MPDVWTWVTLGSLWGLMGLVGALLLGLRAAGRALANVPGQIQSFINAWLWEEAEVEDGEGVKKITRTLSPAARGLIGDAAPLFGQMLVAQLPQLLKKLKVATPEGGSVAPVNEDGSVNFGGLASFLPKSLSKYAPLLGLLFPGAGGLGGGGGGTQGGANPPPNAFLGKK